jgi:hypothetical protein
VPREDYRMPVQPSCFADSLRHLRNQYLRDLINNFVLSFVLHKFKATPNLIARNSTGACSTIGSDHLLLRHCHPNKTLSYTRQTLQVRRAIEGYYVKGLPTPLCKLLAGGGRD